MTDLQSAPPHARDPILASPSVGEPPLLHDIGRKLLWVYALLVLVAAFGYARYDGYIMDGDGTAFLDIAQELNTHRAALAVNGYWNPGYPTLVAIAERVAHPSLWRELTLVRYVNVLIVVLAMLACIFFTTGLVLARTRGGDVTKAAVPAPALHLLGLAMLLLSLQRELPVAAPRADTLLFALLLFAGGLLLRILADNRRLWHFSALGVVLGLAYLTKSFAFLPSIALLAAFGLFGLLRPAERRWILLGSGLCAVVFALIAGPYIAAISRQLGHFTTGESARLNYAFFVDGTPRWHEWFHHDLGHAGGLFLHPETALATQPPIFSYAAHPVGTFPLWFDPAWWTLGLKPHVWLPGHLARLLRNIVVFARYLLGRPEPFVLLGVLLVFGAKPPYLHRRFRENVWFFAPVAWGLLMLAIYFPIDLQDRYLTAPLFLVVLPLFAGLQTPRVAAPGPPLTSEAVSGTPSVLANALILLFAGIVLSQSATHLADRRRHTSPAEQGHPGFAAQIFTASAALNQLGLKPGDKIACMGDLACYTDFYWARLAGTQILGQVETPHQATPVTVWNSTPDKRTITAPLAHMGLRYIVSLFPNAAGKPEGWVQLGDSNFFAYPLEGPVSPTTAAQIANFRPTP